MIRYGSRKVLFITLYCYRNTRCIQFRNKRREFVHVYVRCQEEAKAIILTGKQNGAKRVNWSLVWMNIVCPSGEYPKHSQNVLNV